MKKVKIKFVDFFDGFDKGRNEFLEVLKQRYEIDISDEPDYVIYSGFGYEHLKYNCIRTVSYTHLTLPTILRV